MLVSRYEIALYFEFTYIGSGTEFFLNSSSHSQLALLVEFLSEILFVGAPPARMTRTEKSLI
ncbi:hypothetical protein BUZ25_09090 [Staphylococcus haemolyticus]|nr:hypothetical protein BUZ25_09090 [Staphylococcus haemolyticus]